jgi:hypothetical protein
MRVAPAVEANTTDVIFWARNVFALRAQELGEDDAEARFFAESIPDREAAAYRQHPSLSAVVKLLSVMVPLGGSTDRKDADLFLNAVSILSLLSHRLWEDIGGPGDPQAYARDLEAGMQSRLTGRIRATETKR